MLDPVLEDDEIFDSNLLRDFVVSEIGKGNRNFALDCSGLDYIYSDTINVLLSLNSRVLDVNGRLTLVAPGPEVTQTLKKTGVHNILKVYQSEMDLQQASDDLIMQTSSIKMSDVAQAQKPKT
ncbi:MAG: STAS domain-containing protein, partial [Chitinivibrionales bacterium]|nr:STAS domain-containing protein [Chitinivibrionales bacterium]